MIVAHVVALMFLKDIPIAIPDEATAIQLEQLQLALVNLNRSDVSIVLMFRLPKFRPN